MALCMHENCVLFLPVNNTIDSIYYSIGICQVAESVLKLQRLKNQTDIYRISIKFGGELNLANWRFVTKSPNINFVNIIFKLWVKQLMK